MESKFNCYYTRAGQVLTYIPTYFSSNQLKFAHLYLPIPVQIACLPVHLHILFQEDFTNNLPPNTFIFGANIQYGADDAFFYFKKPL